MPSFLFFLFLTSHCSVYVTVSEGPRGVLQWISYAFMLPFRFFFTTFIDIIKFACKFIFAIIWNGFHDTFETCLTSEVVNF